MGPHLYVADPVLTHSPRVEKNQPKRKKGSFVTCHFRDISSWLFPSSFCGAVVRKHIMVEELTKAKLVLRMAKKQHKEEKEAEARTPIPPEGYFPMI